MIDDSTTYLQPQQSGPARLLCCAVCGCACVNDCLDVTANKKSHTIRGKNIQNRNVQVW